MKFRILLAALLLLVVRSACAQLYFLEDDNGLYYQVNTTTGAATLVATINLVTSDTIGLTEGPPGIMYGSTWMHLIRFNVNGTGAVDLGVSNAEGLAYCIPSGILYGAINGSFFSINQSNGVQTPLASLPGDADVEGLACDHVNNVVYGLESGAGNLYRYTPGTDTWALVGNTGVDFEASGLAMDATAGVLYGLGSQDTNLYRINPLTAAATVVGPTGLGTVGGGLGFSTGGLPPPPPPPAIVAVPTLSGGLIAALALLLAAVAGLALARRASRA